MIGILQNKHLDSRKMQKIINDHYSNVILTIKRSRTHKMHDVNNDILNYTSGRLTFEIIVKADYNKIKSIINKYAPFTNSVSKYKTLFERYRINYGNKLIESLELTVCPYCNRNFINSSPDLDHFFPISKHPLFSLSLYNLIPACTVCNRKKSNKAISVSPYDITKKTDSIIKFTLDPKNMTYFSLIIKILDKQMQSNADTFKLQNSYEIHSDIIKELYFKTLKYPKNYIKSLEKLAKFPISINMTPEEFYYGNYFKESDYYKRPLSKMTKDIIDFFKKNINITSLSIPNVKSK
ncbi:MAG: HNH endonuclease [Treponema sp.]|nr:HNH endonuclease [Treponema sp.]